MQARRIAWITVGLAAVFFGPTVITSHADEIDIGRGPVTVYVPASYDPSVATPLVTLLHGFGNTGAGTEARMQLIPFAEEFGFLYTFPDGTPNADGNQFWNATDACCAPSGSNVDDSGYLRELIETIKDRYSVDPRRVFLIGFSNGGFMSFRMACEHAETIAAIVSVSGATHNNPADCPSTAPVHVLQIHGTADSVIFFGGGSIGASRYPGALATVEQWATLNGCPDTAQGWTPDCGSRRGSPCDMSIPPFDIDPNLPGAETTITRYGECELGGSSELWRVEGGAHAVSMLEVADRRRVVEWLLDGHEKLDCNGNGVPDEQEIADGTARDLNGNGMPDACELHLFGDLDLDGDIDLTDYLSFSQCVGPSGVEPTGTGCCRRTGGSKRGAPQGPCNSPADLDGDDDVDLTDQVIFQASFTGPR